MREHNTIEQVRKLICCIGQKIRHSFTLEHAPDGQYGIEAYQRLVKESSTLLVFVDYHMPRKNGLEFLQEAQAIKTHPNVHFFGYSDSFPETPKVKHTFLVNVRSAELEQKIKECLNGPRRRHTI